jgi:hypothetical protein
MQAVPLDPATQDKGVVTTNAPEAQSYKAGGTPIVIPPPTNDLVEVGYENREFMEVIVVPTSNRLLAAFVSSDDLPFLRKSSIKMLSKYSMVQVPRRGEYVDISADDFKQMIGEANQEFSNVCNSTVHESEEEFNWRMKSLDLEEVQANFGKPIQLGTFFSKEDAYGFGLITPLSMNGATVKIATATAMLRAKNRVLFTFVCAEYKDQETLKWHRGTTEDWADAILKANKQ